MGRKKKKRVTPPPPEPKKVLYTERITTIVALREVIQGAGIRDFRILDVGDCMLRIELPYPPNRALVNRIEVGVSENLMIYYWRLPTWILMRKKTRRAMNHLHTYLSAVRKRLTR